MVVVIDIEEVGHMSFYITKKYEYHYRSVDSAGILCTVSTIFTLFVFISYGEAGLSILVDKNHRYKSPRSLL